MLEKYRKRVVTVYAEKLTEARTVKNSVGEFTGQAGDYRVVLEGGEETICPGALFREIFVKKTEDEPNPASDGTWPPPGYRASSETMPANSTHGKWTTRANVDKF